MNPFYIWGNDKPGIHGWIFLCWIGALILTWPVSLLIGGRFFTRTEMTKEQKESVFIWSLFWPLAVQFLLLKYLFFKPIGFIFSNILRAYDQAYKWFGTLTPVPPPPPPEPPHVGDYRSTKDPATCSESSTPPTPS